MNNSTTNKGFAIIKTIQQHVATIRQEQFNAHISRTKKYGSKSSQLEWKRSPELMAIEALENATEIFIRQLFILESLNASMYPGHNYVPKKK